MSYIFKPDCRYRMPTHFGPSIGPRQGPNGRRYANTESPNDTTVQASFKVDKAQLEKFLPPGFSLRQPYVLNLSFSYITNIEWLAGRGYNTFGVSVPATYRGATETIHGELLLVIWENRADPIITGREELGFSKIYCEIPEPQWVGQSMICRAGWDGFEFASIRFKRLREVTLDELPKDSQGVHPSAGTLHYKYIPKTGSPGIADAEYAVLTPERNPNLQIQQVMQADTAAACFHEATWEQLPTLVEIVNSLCGLTLGKCMTAVVLKMRGGKDLSDHRIIT